MDNPQTLPINQIIHGDCLKVLKTFPPNSIDTVITDPPAGISFMSKSWDSDKGGRDKWVKWLGEVMAECYRVAKPGATALVWALPRTSHWTALALEKGGWKIKDCIYYLFGSGFPKSLNVGKSIDKLQGNKREVIGRNPNSREKCDKSNTLYESGTVGKTDYLTKGSSEWDGWGTALKPAVECWWVAMKPNEGSYAQNALKYGVAGLNIDGGRIGTEEEIGRDNTGIKGSVLEPKDGWNDNSMVGLDTRGKYQGRFPANIILDEEAAKMLDEMSGESGSGKKQITKHNISIGGKGIYGGGKDFEGLSNYGDTGGASRFFKVIK